MQHPNKWLLIQYPEGELAVFATWSGGYLDGDSWRRSSPIVEMKPDTEAVLVTTASGSQYLLPFHSIGVTAYGNVILASLLGEEFKGKILESEAEIHKALLNFMGYAAHAASDD